MTEKIDVSHMAEQARLDLTADERCLLQGQLETIVGYVGQIASVAISGTDATMHGQPLGNVMREDGLCRPWIAKGFWRTLPTVTTESSGCPKSLRTLEAGPY